MSRVRVPNYKLVTLSLVATLTLTLTLTLTIIAFLVAIQTR